METTNNNNNSGPEETKWNGEQHIEQHTKVNEGFSGENLSKDYDPAKLKSEIEIDQHGNEIEVKRARHEDATTEDINSTPSVEGSPDNRIIENKESLQNRDRNYDSEANRYPASHPDNQKNRGNIELGES